MRQVRYTRRAREDLLYIWTYVASHNPGVADKIYDRIEESCLLLRDHPQLGPARPEIAQTARLLVVDRWLVLYQLTENHVQVVRIIDAARDLTRVEWMPE